MKDIERPDPDVLLARVQSEESERLKGKLKIFLGYAAGVGKTFSMLEAAQQRKDQNIDVVIGLVETHGRKDTEAKLADLEIIPRKISQYHGSTLSEMDIDAILARHPIGRKPPGLDPAIYGFFRHVQGLRRIFDCHLHRCFSQSGLYGRNLVRMSKDVNRGGIICRDGE